MSEQQVNFGALGMDLEQSLKQVKKGKLTYALNAMVEGFDGQFVNYQNEQGNELCVTLPEGYKVIGVYTIYEQNKIIYFLTNPSDGNSEIGWSMVDGCTYTTIINAKCLNFSVDHPILSVAHRIGNCTTQLFWVDGYNRDRWIDLENLPYKEIYVEGNCENQLTQDIDCNKININPFFSIPTVQVESVQSDSTLLSGTYQFAAQYCNINGEAYTSYYSVSNPLPLFDVNNVTLDFNAPVSKSITVSITGLDNTGFYDYFNLAVVKTINNVSTVQLVGTYKIVNKAETIIYTGQSILDLIIQDIAEVFPIYEKSNDLTTINNILVRDQLTAAPRLSYQEIANQITIEWETYKLTPQYSYADPLVAANYRTYMRDEVYAFEIVFLLNDGRQTDRFHIPGRLPTVDDTMPVYNNDTLDPTKDLCEADQPLPKWKVYNTAISYGPTSEYLLANNPSCYIGSYETGKMAYWESTETYPCDPDIWGSLAGQPIRHHKFPDSLITHIHDADGNIYPIGIRISVLQIREAIENSSLTRQEKDAVVGFKITRANRANNKSIVAKGLIHNVGKYTKANTDYYFPNYPYNDLGEDEFISNRSQPYSTELPEIPTSSCQIFQLVAGASADTDFQYKDCGDPTASPAVPAKMVSVTVPMGTTLNVCTLGDITVTNSVTDATVNFISDCDSTCTGCTASTDPNVISSANLQPFANADEAKRRYVFHSPDTHFYQPFLGNILKLETAEFGTSIGHFVQVKDHAKYKLYTSGLYLIAAGAGVTGGIVSGILSLGQQSVNVAIQTYVTVKEVLEKVTPRINYAYQYNSVGNYNNFTPIANTGNKQRFLDIYTYMNPGYANVGDTLNVNNFQRESSVYLRTTKTLPYTHQVGAPVDNSRWLPDCDHLDDTETKNISSYYAALKNIVVNQYGQIYSYESVDTGFQAKFSDLAVANTMYVTVFGGDSFINRFAYKSKLPYFFDNRVGDVDGSDVFYNEIGNVGEPQYWFSLDPTLGGSKFSIFGVPVTKLHCQNTRGVIYKRGRMYLFSYGIPYFFCESEVNVDYRQAFNNKEGDFYPHVGSGIPDNWLQESFVSIAFDNTYYYNRTYSKQNKEFYYPYLPPDFRKDDCVKVFPFRAVFSEAGSNDPLITYSNNWLIYKPSSFFDFPQSFGKLTDLTGMEYNQVLARFENRSQIYNALLTAPTSTSDVYLGQPIFSSTTPPIDLSNTDMGYAGSRHRFILRTEYGTISVDDKRGHVFLLSARQVKSQLQNLTLQDSGVEQFFNKNLEVQLPKYIPNVPIDNHYNGVGITGVYDAKYDRFILTKIDYIPHVDGIVYDNGKFYYNENEIILGDPEYFCNKSFTISFDFAVQSWVSFHSYIPSYYIGSSNFFISGTGNTTWRHLTPNNFCKFYNEQAPYIIEYPYAFEFLDEILQAVQDFSKTLQYDEDFNFIEVNDVYFNKAILYNNQQCSGVLKLAAKPRNNLNEYMKYPIYESDAKTILYTKSDNFYKINQFWSLVKNHKQPIFKKTCQSLSFDKELNQENMNYSKMSFNKAPLRAKDLKCRFILDNRTDTRIVSQLLAIETQKSYK